MEHHMSVTVGSRAFADIDQLEKLVIHAATQYELNGLAEDFDGVEITDPEYDELYKNLKQINPTSRAFKGTSPSTAKVKGPTVKHDPPMTSIAKADGDLDEKIKIYESWINECSKRLGKKLDVEAGHIVQSYKRDGVALRVNYVDGKLISAGLRPRDGVNGSDVTRHMKYIRGVPQTLALPLTLSLNGEIECWNADFAAMNVARDNAGEEPFRNPRNYTAGCMGRDDPEENKDGLLRIAFYSITGFDDWRNYYKTEVERAKWANSTEGLNLQDDGKGYFVQVRHHLFKHLQMMEDYAANLFYYTDGIVLKINDLEDQEELGHTGDDSTNTPRSALAWKFVEETAEAEVSSIEWNASRTGRVVPTALFDKPFTLADTDNSRATCNNYGWMESQGLGPGARVLCKKGGKIIPNIMQVLSPVSNVGAPVVCPTCFGTLLVVTSSSGNKDLTCPNKDCGAKHVKSWIFYLTKMGGKGLGLSMMEKLLHTGKIKTLVDLYELTVDDLLAVGLTDRQATLALATIFVITPEKDNAVLLKNIEVARKTKQSVEAWQFFAALGIPGAGETAGKALFKHFGDFDKIRRASTDDLQQVPGIGETTAKSVVEWLQEHSTTVEGLLQRIELELPKSGKLTGKNFVLTGAFTLGKKHHQKQIEDQGGNCQSSVGKDTHYLLMEQGKGDGSPSDKEMKAAKYGTAVISVADLQRML